MHPKVDVDDVAGAWRVVVSIGTPDQWITHPATFWPGLVMLLLGLIALITYTQSVGPSRLTAIEYPAFTLAAWCFGALALLSILDTSAHVADVGSRGLDWRFLADVRGTPIDITVASLSGAACLATWLASWGFVSGRWATPTNAAEHQDEA